MKVCAVTGGAMGIGKEIVKTFAGSGNILAQIDAGGSGGSWQ